MLGGTVSLRNVTAYAIGSDDNRGVSSSTNGHVSLVNVEAIGSGGTNSTGFRVGDGNGSVRNSVISATGAMSNNEGISSVNSDGLPHLITVQNSNVTGATASINRASSFSVRIGQSQLAGPVMQADTTSGTYACVGAYNQDFAPVLCP